jgi:hypothetical protein
VRQGIRRVRGLGSEREAAPGVGLAIDGVQLGASSGMVLGRGEAARRDSDAARLQARRHGALGAEATRQPAQLCCGRGNMTTTGWDDDDGAFLLLARREASHCHTA